MSIVETYRDQFLIYCYDEDISRGDKIGAKLKKEGFQFTHFTSRGLFLETLKIELPHVVMLYYQPLNMKFREMLSSIHEISSEIQVILLGNNEFWPGIYSLIQSGQVHDFWSWPIPGEEVLELRLNHVIENHIYKYVAEQRSSETQKIVEKLESFAQREESQSDRAIESDVDTSQEDVTSLIRDGHSTEAQIIEELIANLKSTFPNSEFIYFKNYTSKKQLLVTRTSFASENYFRGQSVPFDLDSFRGERGETLNHLRDSIVEQFSCEDFVMQPVELGDDFFGLIMAVNCEDATFIQKTARYLSISLRNFKLEMAGTKVDVDFEVENEIPSRQLLLNLSTEVSRARRLKSPLSLIIAQIEYVGDDNVEFGKAYKHLKNSVRSYDRICRLSDNQVAIVLPHCSYEDAAIKSETIRRQLIALGLKTQNTPLRLCFGVSEFPRLSSDSDALIVDAKKACTQVMVSGKNKVCLYTAPENFEPEFSLEL